LLHSVRNQNLEVRKKVFTCSSLLSMQDAGETTVTDVHVAEASPLPMECLATNTTVSCGSTELPSEGGSGRQVVSAKVTMVMMLGPSIRGDQVDMRDKERLAAGLSEQGGGEGKGVFVQGGGEREGDTADTVAAIRKEEIDATLLNEGLQVEFAEKQSLSNPGNLMEVREDDQPGGEGEGDGLIRQQGGEGEGGDPWGGMAKS